MRKLNARERDILRHRFALEGAEWMTGAALAKKYGVSTSRIWQIETASIRRILKKYLEDEPERNKVSGY